MDQSPNHAAKNVADIHASSFFQSANSKNQFVCYDFKDKTIIPTHYSIGMCFSGLPGGHNWRSWVVEMSTDGNVWTEFDRHENNSDLNDGNITKTYPISVQKECRMFRIRQIGPNWAGTYHICFSDLEVYGTLIQNS